MGQAFVEAPEHQGCIRFAERSLSVVCQNLSETVFCAHIAVIFPQSLALPLLQAFQHKTKVSVTAPNWVNRLSVLWPRGAHFGDPPALPEFVSGLDALERNLAHFELVRVADASPLEVYGDRYSSLAASPFDEEDVFRHYTEAGQRAAGELLARHVWGNRDPSKPG